jgi:alpha-1,2-mannosyltransferase
MREGGDGVTTRYTTPLEQPPGSRPPNEVPVPGNKPRWLAQLGRLPTWVFVLGYAVAAAGCGALALTGGGHLVDLHVYLTGGQAVFHGSRLYQVHYARLPFTYPPFAAVLFAALNGLPWTAAGVLITVVSAVLFPVMLYLALRLPPVSRWLDPAAALRLALLAATAGIWLEPVRTTLGYGQVNLLLGVAVLYDLSRGDQVRHKGLLIGIAAGVKLTPGVFAVYLLLTRRYRAAALAAASFAATVAVGFAASPASSRDYWLHLWLNPGHISPVQNAANQSLYGALSRNLHSPDVRLAWLLAAAVIAVAGLALAALAQRGGDEATGFSLCAVTGLLISPISWTHHWVMAVPALLLATVAALLRAGQGKPGGKAALLGVAVLACAGWAGIAHRVPGHHWLHLDLWGLISSEIYVLAGLAVLALAAVLAVRRAISRDCGPGRQPAGR